MDDRYFIEKCSGAIRRLLTHEGAIKERLSEEAGLIFRIISIPELEHTQEAQKMIKDILMSGKAVISDGQQIKSGFDVAIENIDDETASKLIENLYYVFTEVKENRDLKR